jgi:hypothetical protein
VARSRQTSSGAANQLRAALAAERARGKSTRVVAAEFNIAETSVRDLLSGRRGVTERKAAAALEAFGNRERFPVLLAGGHEAFAEPRTMRALRRLAAWYNADRRARETGDWRVVTDAMRGRATIETTDQGTVTLETNPRVLREPSDAGANAPYRDVRFVSPKRRRRA